jgi:hypothetical protein
MLTLSVRLVLADAQEWARMNDTLRRQVADLEAQVAAMRMEVLARHGPGCGCPQAVAYQAYATQMGAPPPPPHPPLPMLMPMAGPPVPGQMPMPMPMPVPVPA